MGFPKHPIINIGDRYCTVNGCWYTIKEFLGKDDNSRNHFLIEFDSGYITKVRQDSIHAGNIRDNLSPNICGVACLGYANYNDNYQAHHIWRHIISRCYYVKDRNYCRYGGIGIRVCDRWLRFDHFLEDLPFIDGYNEYLFNNAMIHLDKDIKQIHLPHSKRIYSKETCTFVTPQINMLYAMCPRAIPIGVLNILTGNIDPYKSIRQAAISIGVHPETIRSRLYTDNIYNNYKFLIKPYRRI